MLATLSILRLADIGEGMRAVLHYFVGWTMLLAIEPH